MEPPHYLSSGDSGDDVDNPIVGPTQAEVAGDGSPTAIIKEEISNVVEDNLSRIQASSISDTEVDEASPETMSPRAYQLEMLSQSLKQNVIVAVRLIP